jgi:hypothetical protein
MQLVHILEALAIALAEYISPDMEARTTLFILSKLGVTVRWSTLIFLRTARIFLRALSD